jgi:hypothetical protein
LDELYVPKGKVFKLIREANTSKIVGHIDVGKTMANLQRKVYWPKMQEYLAWFIIGFILYCTSKLNNMKQGIYYPLPIPTRPWERISMDFMGGLKRTKRGHDYLFMVEYTSNKMCIHIPCNKTIKGQDVFIMFF